MPDRSKTLGDVIRETRVNLKKGLREFARDLDIAPSYLSDIENDRRVPADDVLRKIADSLGVNFNELMALAGRVGENAERFLRRRPEAVKLFRKIIDKDMSDSGLRKLSEEVDKLDGGTEEPK